MTTKNWVGKDFYAVLGVESTASVEEIKSEYRWLAKKFHPDTNDGDERAAKRFQEINEAYEVLSHPELREKYDRGRQGNHSEPTKPAYPHRGYEYQSSKPERPKQNTANGTSPPPPTAGPNSAQIRPSNVRLVAGVVAASFLLLSIVASAIVAISVASVSPNGLSSSPPGLPHTDAYSTGLEVGMCLNDMSIQTNTSITEFPIVSCQSPHDSEVFAHFLLAGNVYPGPGVIGELATTRCLREFSAFAEIDFSSSTLDFSYYYPTQESWSRGDRSVHCAIYDPNRKTVGSLRGQAR